MNAVRITLRPDNDRDKIKVLMTVEGPQGGGQSWKTISETMAVTGDPSEEQTILLAEDQRLIISGVSKVVYVYDAEQGAVVAQHGG